MASLLLSRPDIDFVLYEWLNVVGLTSSPRYAEHSRETFDSVLDVSERLATELFAPHYQKADRCEPSFDGTDVSVIADIGVALAAFAHAGLPAAQQDYETGGMQLPVVVEKACFAYLNAAGPATVGYAMLTIANANLILAHGNEAQKKAFAMPQLQGKFFGTMCLTEQQAGSSLSDITTRALYERESELGPQYRLFGSKMWISGGDHNMGENIVHLVLAKAVAPGSTMLPGVKNISLFIVPKVLTADNARNDVVCAGLNHKMGFRATSNCLLNFGEGSAFTPGGKVGAIGYLVGELHHGLRYMFQMMNEARIHVGLGAAALGYTGYLHALDYARSRRQGREAGKSGKDPSAAQQFIVEHPDVKRMLLAQKAYAEGALALVLYCSKLVDDIKICTDPIETKSLQLLLDLMTPITKSWPSQWCVVANYLAIQVHGGYGYSREYKAEQFYRDNRLNPIHEGTHGIQALDLLGRKVFMQQGAALEIFAARVRATTQRAQHVGALIGWAKELDECLDSLIAVTRSLGAVINRTEKLSDATAYLEAFGHITVAWIWLDQCLCFDPKESDFHRGKFSAARYFFRWELPKVAVLLEAISKQDRINIEVQSAWL